MPLATVPSLFATDLFKVASLEASIEQAAEPSRTGHTERRIEGEISTGVTTCPTTLDILFAAGCGGTIRMMMPEIQGHAVSVMQFR